MARKNPSRSYGFIVEPGCRAVVEQWLAAVGVGTDRSEHNKLTVLTAKEGRLVIGSRANSPGVAVDLEVMRKDFRVTDVFRIGTCGAYAKALGIGALVLVTDAIRGEGTSRCYMAEESFPAACDFQLTKGISLVLDRNGQRYASGTFWTTDGRIASNYDRRIALRMVRHHVLGIDMESSCFFVVSKLLGMRSANLSVVSDFPLRSRQYAVTKDDARVEKGLQASVSAYWEYLLADGRLGRG